MKTRMKARKTDYHFSPYHEPSNREVLAAIVFQVLIMVAIAGIIVLAYLVN